MKKKYFILLVPFIAVFSAFIISKIFLLFMNVSHFICPVYFFTGLLCPGCGGTRAVAHLMKGDILLAFRCNPSLFIIMISAVIYYIQTVLKTFGCRKKIIPESKVFYITATGIIMIFYVLRNVFTVLQPV